MLRHPNLKYGERPVWLGNNDCGVIFGLPKLATQAFLSRWRSSRARASLSPPTHTGGRRPSVSKPENHFEKSIWSRCSPISLIYKSNSVESSHSDVRTNKRKANVTKFFERWDTVMIVVIFFQRGVGRAHANGSNGRHRWFRRIHAGNHGLKLVIGQRRLPCVPLDDPETRIFNKLAIQSYFSMKKKIRLYTRGINQEFQNHLTT